jgi:hypothetical protein
LIIPWLLWKSFSGQPFYSPDFSEKTGPEGTIFPPAVPGKRGFDSAGMELFTDGGEKHTGCSHFINPVKC